MRRTLRVASQIVAVSSLAAGFGAARPVPGIAHHIVEYAIPRPNAFPHDPAVGADGIVWYTDMANSFIGRLDPSTGKITDYPTPTPHSGPHGILVAPDGGVWYTANAAGKLGRLDPATGQIREYALPPNARDPHTPLFHDGKVWFTAQGSNLYGELDPATAAVRIFPLTISHALPYGLVAGHDGGLWMALFGTNAIARIDPATGALREFRVPDDKSRPRRLIVDGQGHVWFTDYAQGKLGELDPATGQVREFASPGGAEAGPYGIALAPDGRIWYDEAGTSHVIVFDPKTDTVDEVVDIPTKGAIIRNMAVDGTRDRLWLALSGTGRIGLVALKGGQAGT